MDNYQENNSYIIKEMKPRNLLSFILLTIIILFIYGLSISVTNTMQVSGVIKNNNLILIIPYQDIQKIMTENKILIDETDYNYKIIDISKEIDLVNNINIQYVTLDLKLPKKYLHENLVINARIILNKKKIINRVKEILFEGRKYEKNK